MPMLDQRTMPLESTKNKPNLTQEQAHLIAEELLQEPHIGSTRVISSKGGYCVGATFKHDGLSGDLFVMEEA